MEFRPLVRGKAEHGDRIVMLKHPEIPVTFRMDGHDGYVVVRLDDGFMPERQTRDVILKRRDCGVPA